MLQLLFTLLTMIAVAGCARRQVNPSFAITPDDAQQALRAMKSDPKPLARPVVVLGGFLDPGIGALSVRNAIKPTVTNPDLIIHVTFLECTDFDQCRRKVIRAVEAKFPSVDPKWTTDVDVIGVSMGGLVARISAETGPEDERRLKINRLFTLASPLQGAKLAEFPLVMTQMHADMREDSEFLRKLNATPPAYPVFPYTRLHDPIVGEALSSPAGQTSWWLDNEPLQPAHMGMMVDSRVMADIARRLRDEAPYATDPPAPLPQVASNQARKSNR